MHCSQNLYHEYQNLWPGLLARTNTTWSHDLGWLVVKDRVAYQYAILHNPLAIAKSARKLLCYNWGRVFDDLYP